MTAEIRIQGGGNGSRDHPALGHKTGQSSSRHHPQAHLKPHLRAKPFPALALAGDCVTNTLGGFETVPGNTLVSLGASLSIFTTHGCQRH